MIGALVVRGPAGLLAFHRTLAPGEWRALRLRLKVALIGANVARSLRTLDADPRSIVVVGGPAGDDEVLGAVTGALPAGTAVGRGNVGCRAGSPLRRRLRPARDAATRLSQPLTAAARGRAAR